MFDERSFSQSSFDTRSWYFGIINAVRIGASVWRVLIKGVFHAAVIKDDSRTTGID